MESKNVSASVVIPTLNAGESLGNLIKSLWNQSVRIHEIVVIDSSSNDDTVKIAKDNGARVIVIRRKDFDHGGTRHKAFLSTDSDFVLFLTQDALPTDSKYVENLLVPFSDPSIGVSTGRQVPRSDARYYEKLVRYFNYPGYSFIRDISDVNSLGIKAFFVSDVCSAYRRSAYLHCGGFDYPCNTNEDMLMAAKMLKNGYKIAYAADARVVHSHNLSLRQQYRRNKEIGIFLASHSNQLMNVSESSEGVRLVSAVSKQLLSQFHFLEFVSFVLDCVARLAGNRAGRRSY